MVGIVRVEMIWRGAGCRRVRKVGSKYGGSMGREGIKRLDYGGDCGTVMNW